MTFTKYHIAIVIAASIMTAEANAIGIDDETRASEEIADVSKEGKTDLSLFSTVNEKGTNLRHVLASTNIVSSVIPFGPNITFVQINSGAGLLRGGVFDTVTKDYFNAIHRLCPTGWEIKDTEQDIMTGKKTWILKDVSKQQLIDDPYVVNAHNTTTGQRVSGAVCKGVFEWDGINTIRHLHGQPYIWKLDGKPSYPEVAPSDGVVPTGYFGEEYKPGFLGVGKYPFHLETAAWAIRLCEVQNGKSKMALINAVYAGSKRPIVHDSMELIYPTAYNRPNDYYFACESDKGGFLVLVENRQGERRIQRIVFQKGRTLESVGIR